MIGLRLGVLTAGVGENVKANRLDLVNTRVIRGANVWAAIVKVSLPKHASFNVTPPFPSKLSIIYIPNITCSFQHILPS